jgi:hypothetical protein
MIVIIAGEFVTEWLPFVSSAKTKHLLSTLEVTVKWKQSDTMADNTEHEPISTQNKQFRPTIW